MGPGVQLHDWRHWCGLHLWSETTDVINMSICLPASQPAESLRVIVITPSHRRNHRHRQPLRSQPCHQGTHLSSFSYQGSLSCPSSAFWPLLSWIFHHYLTGIRAPLTRRHHSLQLSHRPFADPYHHWPARIYQGSYGRPS